MSIITEYIGSLKKQFPDSQPVREQLEELRDTLHIKAEEYATQGKPYEEAAHAAIESLGDVMPLLGEVAGDFRNVYINRLTRNNALLATVLILAQFIAGWLAALLIVPEIWLVKAFLYSVLALVIGICIWPAIACINYRREPLKTEAVNMPFRSLMRTALIGWLCISLALFGINMMMGKPLWFMWPVIGIFNWPLNIFVYHRQFISGKYDV